MNAWLRSVVFVSIVALGGCSDVTVPDAHPTTGRAPKVAEVPGDKETVRGEDDPPIVTLNYSRRFQERRLTRSDPLPSNIIVPKVNLDAVPVSAALQAVLTGTDVALSWDASSFDDRLVSITNVSGALPGVVDKICTAAKIFCTYRNGLLEMKAKETFIIDLPYVPGKVSSSASSSSSSTSSSDSSSSSAASNSIAEAIGELAGGEKPRVDMHGGNLIYTTDVEGQERVREYLDRLRHGRPLIVMQLYIWEVTLNRDNATGINWSNFKFPKIGGSGQNMLLSGLTGFTDITSPGVSLGAKLSGKVDAQGVLKFLATQGQVQTISNPQLTFISGSNADFRVGGKQRYISQVGQVTNSVSTSSSTLGTNTVSTDSLDTGLSVGVNGSFENGVISAILSVSLQDVVSLNPTSTEQGVTIDLPETTERKVETTLRVRPGDNLVLAGLVSSRDDDSRDRIPLPFGARLTTQARDTLKNSELVILVKPSVVVFNDVGVDEMAQSGVMGISRPAVPLGPVEPSDARTMGGPVEPTPTPAPARSLPVQTAPLPLTPTAPAPVSSAPPLSAPPVPQSEPAPAKPVVSGKLLQSGFDQAYDAQTSSRGGGS